MQGRKTKMPFSLKKIYERLNEQGRKKTRGPTESSMLSAVSIIEVRCFARDGRKCVYLCEAEKILKYTEGEIVLRLKKENISFFGNELSLSGFRSGTAEVMGNITEIAFGEKKKR